MNIKTIGVIFAVIILVIPIQPVFAKAQQSELKNEDALKSGSNSSIIDMINMVNESMIWTYLVGLVDIGSRYTGSGNCVSASHYVYNEFEKLGLDVYIDQWFFPRYSCRNVVATLNGSDSSSDAAVVVCAHYDTISYPKPYDRSPGANDDGAGVAAMLAIANICSKYTFAHTIRFVALSGEEEGTFGSHADAKKAYEKSENIIAVLNIDGIGYASTTSSGKLLSAFANERSEWIVRFSNEIAEKYTDYLDITVQHSLGYPADQDSYNDYGYAGVQYVQPYVEQCYWIHTANDTLDKINVSYVLKVTKLLMAVTAELAQKPIDLQVQILTPYEECVYITDRIVIPLYGFNLFRYGFRAMTYVLGEPIVRLDISATEEIAGVYFGVDGNVLYIDREPPYEWKLQRTIYSTFPLIGIHTLNVCVCTESGKNVYDEMDLFVLRPLF